MRLSASISSVLLLLESSDVNGWFFSEGNLSETNSQLPPCFSFLGTPFGPLAHQNKMAFNQRLSFSLGGKTDVSPRQRACGNENDDDFEETIYSGRSRMKVGP